VRKDYKVIQVNTPDPKKTRRDLVVNIGPKLGIDFISPRKTKKDGYTLEIMPYGMEIDDEDDDEIQPIVVRIKKGGQYLAGRANEMNFQQFIRSKIADDGECHLKVSDNYGKVIELDIVDVVDTSKQHGVNGEVKRADTTVKLKDGTWYGISQKKTNATWVCKVKKLLKDILFRSE